MASSLVPQVPAYVLKRRPAKLPTSKTVTVATSIKAVEAAMVEAYARQEGLSRAAVTRRALLLEATGNLIMTPENRRLEKALYTYYKDYTPDWMQNPVQEDDVWFVVSIPGVHFPAVEEAAKNAGFKNVSEWLTHLAITESAKEPPESASTNPEGPNPGENASPDSQRSGLEHPSEEPTIR